MTRSGFPYIVMPFHARGSLDTRLRRQGPCEVDEVLDLGIKIAGAWRPPIGPAFCIEI